MIYIKRKIPGFYLFTIFIIISLSYYFFLGISAEKQVILLGIALFSTLLIISRLQYEGLLVAFLVSDNLIHLLKRIIFLFGEQKQITYYGIQLIPTLFLLIIFIYYFSKNFADLKFLRSSRILLTFIILGFITTLVSNYEIPWLVKAMGIQQQWIPSLLFFVGINVNRERIPHIAKLIFSLSIISTLYGIVQVFVGPTFIDKAWAMYSYQFSIQGLKVYAYLTDWAVFGTVPEFRGYSYFPDALTWGLFILAGYICGAIVYNSGLMRKQCWSYSIILIITGIVITFTRTVWVALLATIMLFVGLNRKIFQHASLIVFLATIGLAVVFVGGGYIYTVFFGQIPNFSNFLLQRATNIGTISARIGAIDNILDLLKTNWLYGNGYGYSDYFAERFMSRSLGQVVQSHNFIVDLLLYIGLPGLLLFLAFYISWLKENLSSLSKMQFNTDRNIKKWIIAFSFGMVITGYLNGATFMNSYFFLILGMASSIDIEIAKLKLHAVQNN